MLGLERLGEAADRGEIGEIELHRVDVGARRCGLYLFDSGASLAEIATGEDYQRAFACELERRFVADSAIATSDDDDFAREVGKVVCGPCFVVRHRKNLLEGSKIGACGRPIDDPLARTAWEVRKER
jgi:hypothetical protein